MKSGTKTILVTAAVTTAIGFVIERLLKKYFVEVDEIKQCLDEATDEELRNEISKRRAEEAALSER